MELDPTVCYQAVLSRDRRFDGRFFTGVVTTGIYCRPICPVHPAKFENVRFFACAAAAEAAGFRPCRRCHPETSPGTPAWIGTSAVVSRALRLISEGALDDGNVEDLSLRLGVGSRQLRRLFAERLGASPTAIARARRIHFAVKLIEETELPFTEIAFLAGFSSIRQFNHAVRETFRQAPTERRRRYGLKGRSRQKERSDGPGIIIRLPYRPPFDWPTIVRFLRPRAIPGVEVVEPGRYRRTIEIGGTGGMVELWPCDGEALLMMRVQLPSYDGLMQVVERARRIFDLGADPLQITERLGSSHWLAKAVKARPGLRAPGAWDGFELAVNAVLGQQATVEEATTLAGRLVRTFGRQLDGTADSEPTYLFPKPEDLAAADLSAIGLPKARATTIRALASSVSGRELTLDASQGLDDAVSQLCSIPGIEQWTAHYIAMRALGETDAFPAEDLGLRRALSNGRGPLSADELMRIADEWRPWRAYAVMHLWASHTGNGRVHDN